MSDPRDSGLGWPFVPVDEKPFMGVEIAPNEIVYVVLGGDYRKLYQAYEDLRIEHNQLIEAAEEQVRATNHLLNMYGVNRDNA